MVNERCYILIGGLGFLGRNFSCYLSCLSYKFVIVEKGDLDVVHSRPNKFSTAIENLKLTSHSDDFEYIIVDFAYSSVPKTSFDDPVKDFTENLSNIIKHLDFALSIKAPKYVYISSGGTIYGNTNQDLIAENIPALPISPYGISKLACERYVNMYHHAYGLNTYIVRPSNIYGPGQKPFRGQGFVSTALALAYESKPIKVFGDGSNVRDYLYVEDFCQALAEIVQKGIPGDVYNIGSGLGYSINDIINEIDRVVLSEGKSLNVEYLEDRPFDVAYNVLDYKKLQTITEWQPAINLETGINQTWQWIKKYMSSR